MCVNGRSVYSAEPASHRNVYNSLYTQGTYSKVTVFFTCFDIPVLLQATANVIVFVCVNVVGVFMHNLMEHAQRKAFLDTRNCIAARLEMEDENEKLVRFVQTLKSYKQMQVRKFPEPERSLPY